MDFPDLDILMVLLFLAILAVGFDLHRNLKNITGQLQRMNENLEKQE